MNVSACIANCQAMNEGTGADAGSGAYLTLYRSDYMSQFTSCVASADCTATLQDKAANDCQASLSASFTPASEVDALCQKLGASSCPQDQVASCLNRFAPFATTTIQAVSACVNDPTCANHTACVSHAITP